MMFLLYGLVLENLIESNTLRGTLEGKRVGYYLGSFDPMHLGHEAFANEALEQGLCDYVLIYPVWGGDSYKNRTSVDVRLDILFAAFENHPEIIVTRLPPMELQQALMIPSEAYFDEKPLMKTKIPGVKYIGLIGSDTISSVIPEGVREKLMRGTVIPDKHRADTGGCHMIFPIERFIIGKRVDDPVESLPKVGGLFAGRPIVGIVTTPYDAVSSTEIKKRLQNGKSIDTLVNPRVKEMIVEIYR